MAKSESTMHLFTKEGYPVRYDTKWGDMHEESKNVLIAVQERMTQYREESEKLEQSVDLYKSKVYEENFEDRATHLRHELDEINAAVKRNQASLEALQTTKTILRNTETAVFCFKRLAIRVSEALKLRQNEGLSPHIPEVENLDFYSGLPNKPSQYLQETVSRFEKQLAAYRDHVKELEILFADHEVTGDNLQGPVSYVDSLYMTIQNAHQFLMHVAAKVEFLHQKVDRMRQIHLENLRHKGLNRNPFLEADRREDIQREIEARRMHPTSDTHLTPRAQPFGSSTQNPLLVRHLSQQSQLNYGLVGHQMVAPTAMFQSDGNMLSSAPLEGSISLPHDQLQHFAAGAQDPPPVLKRTKPRSYRKKT
ncbi:nucleoporin p58/p45 [Marchantia polymorpha subsp. ruderalis]|uniref:Uncharacterized protein n=2 Tax=Marchantia polymorpha TaxID=3197 RepID=A0AAF6BQP3_MARPO|nr:hypothetical protein MARPO_0016s0112 [Marchantia polymorpha]PTQ45061.1 hypothetical protein MARPO_0016s0112 [Marchantia polymorpha]BBN14326.1 hypothetical protein Mp_6g10710 [Marchantia polymorpha subsp. ruderalis]BBN14327.1 hypothetical protein Mp_6g10710 [Marchantia polymorpha subsp. ruderalis]|eukprot:PTQ45060.1 hypothetical protein MARPO_0016s0112 [Marchantia polymorpha]